MALGYAPGKQGYPDPCNSGAPRVISIPVQLDFISRRNSLHSFRRSIEGRQQDFYTSPDAGILNSSLGNCSPPLAEPTKQHALSVRMPFVQGKILFVIEFATPRREGG